MRILIRFLLRGEKAPRVLELPPDEYFDSSEEGGMPWSIDLIPKHQHAFEYTGQRADDIRWTVLELSDGGTFWRVRTQLLDGMRSVMTHSQQSDGSEEIIHQTEVCAGCWHTIRTLKQADMTWTVVMNELTTVGPARLLKDCKYCGRWSFEEMKDFGRIGINMR